LILSWVEFAMLLTTRFVTSADIFTVVDTMACTDIAMLATTSFMTSCVVFEVFDKIVENKSIAMYLMKIVIVFAATLSSFSNDHVVT